MTDLLYFICSGQDISFLYAPVNGGYHVSNADPANSDILI